MLPGYDLKKETQRQQEKGKLKAVVARGTKSITVSRPVKSNSLAQILRLSGGGGRGSLGDSSVTLDSSSTASGAKALQVPQVTEDLRCQCFCSDESREAVREQRIVLQRAEALRSSAPGSIRRVLQRVRKYRERGFEIAGYEMFKERLRGRCADERFI